MSNIWGTKRNCLKCGAHFYDLNRNPAACPKCGYSFDPTVVVRPRRGRASRRLAADEMMMSPVPLTSPAVKAGDKAKKPRQEAGEDNAVRVDSGLEELEDDNNLEEISGIEDREGSSSATDDADDESIIEDLEKEKVTSIVDIVGDEEESEGEDEEVETQETKKKPKSKSGLKSKSSPRPIPKKKPGKNIPARKK